MPDKEKLLQETFVGREITAIRFMRSSLELQCEDTRRLVLYARPKVIFEADEVHEELGEAPLSRQAIALIGRTITAVKLGPEEYVLRLGDFAGLSIVKAGSVNGETGVIVDDVRGEITF